MHAHSHQGREGMQTKPPIPRTVHSPVSATQARIAVSYVGTYASAS